MLPSLAEVQGRSFGRPTVIIAEHVGGMEDIPVQSQLPYLAILSTPEACMHVCELQCPVCLLSL